MDKQHVTYLINQYIAGKLTDPEYNDLLTLSQDEQGADLLNVLQDMIGQEAANAAPLDSGMLQNELQKIWAADLQESRSVDLPKIRTADLQPEKLRAPRSLQRWLSAAVLLALLGIGAWWIIGKQPVSTPAVSQAVKPDIAAPANNRATITLANGHQIYLDSADKGAMAQQGSAQLVKLSDGNIVYQKGTGSSKEILYNTLTNPRGSRIISLSLSDGSRVWLNAESSLKYPAVFTGKERQVEITGEAYFEVTEDHSSPFIVKKGNTEVLVLGTHFNINAYDDETSLRVTLLEGSVKIKQEEKEALLQPGQQALIKAGDKQISVISDADVDQAIAWKNGRFAFSGADLPAVMRQLARWYNVQVRYEGDIPVRIFDGKIGKTLTLDQVLQILAQSKVHYNITGNTLIIRP